MSGCTKPNFHLFKKKKKLSRKSLEPKRVPWLLQSMGRKFLFIDWGRQRGKDFVHK